MSEEIVKKGVTISPENAAIEVDKALNYYDIDFDLIEDKDSKANLRKARSKLIKSVMGGRLEFIYENDPKGYSQLTVVQHLLSRKDGHDKEMRYREVDGLSKVQMKHCDDDDSMGKIQAMMGSLAGVGPKPMQKLRGVDLGLMESLGIVFLSV